MKNRPFSLGCLLTQLKPHKNSNHLSSRVKQDIMKDCKSGKLQTFVFTGSFVIYYSLLSVHNSAGRKTMENSIIGQAKGYSIRVIKRKFRQNCLFPVTVKLLLIQVLIYVQNNVVTGF